MGSYTQNKDFHLVDSVSWFVDNGLIKVYTPASIDNDSWYNENIHPADRARYHVLYEQFMIDEVIQPVMHDTGYGKVALAGCSFGAYHATNLGLRHPELISFIINMGGAFDIRDRVKNYYDDTVYFNNPPDYLPGLDDQRLRDMGMIFGTGTQDMCLDANLKMSDTLHAKGIPHFLDIQSGAGHDWPVWREMFPRYIGMLLNEITNKQA